MNKEKRFGVEKAWLFAEKIKVKFSVFGTDDTIDLELSFKDHPDVHNNAEAFASFLVDKAEELLGGK